MSLRMVSLHAGSHAIEQLLQIPVVPAAGAPSEREQMGADTTNKEKVILSPFTYYFPVQVSLLLWSSPMPISLISPIQIRPILIPSSRAHLTVTIWLVNSGTVFYTVPAWPSKLSAHLSSVSTPNFLPTEILSLSGFPSLRVTKS